MLRVHGGDECVALLALRPQQAQVLVVPPSQQRARSTQHALLARQHARAALRGGGQAGGQRLRRRYALWSGARRVQGDG